MDERYNAKGLRAAAAKRLHRSIRDAEWDAIDADGFFSRSWDVYGEGDVDAVCGLLRGKRTARPTDSPTGRARAHGAEVAYGAKDLAVRLRVRCFGRPEPPFGSISEANEWLATVRTALAPASHAMTLAFEIANGTPEMEAVRAIVCWLEKETASTTETKKSVLDLLRGGPLIAVGGQVVALQYYREENDRLVPDTVPVAPRTPLWHLAMASRELAAATQWGEGGAVYHLLTGATVVSAIESEVSRAEGVITIRVRDAAGTGVEAVAAAYKRARKELFEPGSAGDNTRRRSRPSPESAFIGPFVDERSDLSWQDRLREWNELHPDHHKSTPDALRQLFIRATRTT